MSIEIRFQEHYMKSVMGVTGVTFGSQIVIFNQKQLATQKGNEQERMKPTLLLLVLLSWTMVL